MKAYYWDVPNKKKKRDWTGNKLWKKSKSKPMNNMPDSPELKADGVKEKNIKMVKNVHKTRLKKTHMPPNV